MKTVRLRSVLNTGMVMAVVMALSFAAKAADDAAEAKVEGPPASYALSDVEISLRRTACFGRCPIYEVTLFGDGRVVFKGERFVRVEGEAEGSVEQEQIVELLNALYQNYFFDLRDSYNGRPGAYLENGQVSVSEVRITDLPSQILRVRIGNYEKRVGHSAGGPSGLGELIKRVDEIAGSERWVK
jgi:hypothetical protein